MLQRPVNRLARSKAVRDGKEIRLENRLKDVLECCLNDPPLSRWLLSRLGDPYPDPDLLQPPLDRSFKKPGGYIMRDKLEIAKQRAKSRAKKSDK